MIETSSTTQLTPQTEPVRCPYLGRFDDPATWGSFASVDHVCHRAIKPQFIREEYQAQICLTGEHFTCPVFQQAEAWTTAMPAAIAEPARSVNRRLPLIIGVAAALLISGIGLIVLALSLGKPASAADIEPTYQSQRTEIAADSAAIGSPLPTATRYTLPTRTPRPTYAVMVIELIFGANLRTSPGTESAVLANLPSGVMLNIIGRSTSSEWLYIESSDGQQGWIASTQVDQALDFSSVPVINIDNTPADPIIIGSTPLATAMLPNTTASVQPSELPGTFQIVMALEPAASTCNVGAYDSLYAIKLGVSRITITGLGPDITLIDGMYNTASGEFAASGGVLAGFDTMRGSIEFDGTTITVSASRTIEYYKQKCSGSWTLYGTTEDW